MDLSNKDQSLLLFRVGPVLCCAPSLPVSSIISPPALTHPPGSDAGQPGIFRHGQHIVKVMDLRQKFGIDEADQSQPGILVICLLTEQAVAFWVDQIIDVIDFPAKGWNPLPAAIPRGIFSRTLLLQEKIHLYAEFDKLATISGMGYLRQYILQLQQQTTATDAVSAPPPLSTPRHTAAAADTNRTGAEKQPKTPAKQPDHDHQQQQQTAPVKNTPVPPATHSRTPSPRSATQPAPVQAASRSTAPITNTPRSQPQPPVVNPAPKPPVTANTIHQHVAPAPVPATGMLPDEPGDSDSAPVLVLALLLLLLLGGTGTGLYLLLFRDTTITAPTSQPAPSQSLEQEQTASSPIMETQPAPPIPEADTAAAKPTMPTVTTTTEPAVDSPDADTVNEPDSGSRQYDYRANIQQQDNDITITIYEPARTATHHQPATDETAPVVPSVSPPPAESPAAAPASSTTTEAEPASKTTEPAPTDTAPTVTEKKSPPVREIIHIVVKGDTLWAIAKKYVHDPFRYPELARLSNIRNPHRIYPGNRVRIRFVQDQQN